MSSQKNALKTALTGIVVLAILMVGFYYFKDRFDAQKSATDLGDHAPVAEENSEFVGTYSPADGPLEGGGKRIVLFTVNKKEEGGFLGSAKIETIGSGESFFFHCVDVRIEGPNFFLNCQHETEGTISLNGQWEKSDALYVNGKVIWVKDGTALVDQGRRLQLLPNL